MTETLLAITEKPMAYDYIYTPVAVAVDTSLNDGDFEWSHADATTDTVSLYQLSKDYTTNVTFYDASENQTIIVPVRLSVSLTLSLNVEENETIWSNICYTGNWEYSTSVDIIWGDDCPWDNTEKARQRRLVENSFYVEALNIFVENQSQGYYSHLFNLGGSSKEKDSGTFGVEFAEGKNIIQGNIRVATRYTPQYDIVVEQPTNSKSLVAHFVASGEAGNGKTVTVDGDVTVDAEKNQVIDWEIVDVYLAQNGKVITEYITGEQYYPVFSLKLNQGHQNLKTNQILKVTYEGISDVRLSSSLHPLNSDFVTDLQNHLDKIYVFSSDKNIFSLDKEGTYSLTVSLISKDANPNNNRKTVSFEVEKPIIQTGNSCWIATAVFVLRELGAKKSKCSYEYLYNYFYNEGFRKYFPIIGGDPFSSIISESKPKIKEETYKQNSITKWCEKSQSVRAIGYQASFGTRHIVYVTSVQKVKDDEYILVTRDSNIGLAKYKTLKKIQGTWYVLDELERGFELIDGSKYNGKYKVIKAFSYSGNASSFDQEKLFPIKKHWWNSLLRSASTDAMLSTAGATSVETVSDKEVDNVYFSGDSVQFSRSTITDSEVRDAEVTLTGNSVATNLSVFAEGRLTVTGASTLAGDIVVQGQLALDDDTVFDEAQITVDLTVSNSGQSARIENISALAGLGISVQVSDSQQAGQYWIATGGSNYHGDITVLGVSLAGVEEGEQSNGRWEWTIFDSPTIGTLTVGSTLQSGQGIYQLLEEGGDLYLTVDYWIPDDIEAPSVPGIGTCAVNGQDVVISLTPSSDNSGTVYYGVIYSLDADFQDCHYASGDTADIALSGLEDGLYYYCAFAVDAEGNFSDDSEVGQFQVGPDQVTLSVENLGVYLNRYLSENRDYVVSFELANPSHKSLTDFYVKVVLSKDESYSQDDYVLGSFPIDELPAGGKISEIYKFNIPERYLQGDYHLGIVSSDYTDDYQFQVEGWIPFNGENELEYYGTDVLLPNVMPQAEYMYGCTPTAIAMLLGYYDLYGYNDKDFSNLIEGDIDVYSRGTDGNIYNMNAFDTVLGKFIASEDYVYRFFSREELSVITSVSCSSTKRYRETTPTEELPYSFVDGGTTFNTSVWNCLADYIGTGQYWRGQSNLSTSMAYNTLESIINSTSTTTISGDGYSRTIDYKYTTMLYGLYLYVQSRGYELRTETTGTYATDNNGGSFTFEDYMREIDAGRPVIISITDHSMVGYGYNAKTKEIIFDDDYASDQRMVWGESYYYSGQNRNLQSITVVSFQTQPGDRDLAFDGAVQLADQESATDSSYYFFEGNSIYLSFNVVNNGPDPSYSFKIAVKVDGYDYEVFDVNKLSGNEVRQYKDVKLDNLTAGTHQVEVILDTKDTVEESTSTNNKYSTVVQVLPEGMQILSSSITLSSGQSASNTLIVGSGRMTLDGGRAENILLQGNSAAANYYGSRGMLIAKNGGAVKDVEAFNLGEIYVSSGGKAENVVLHSSGMAMVYSGGNLSGLTIESGGYAYNYGGTITNATLDGSLYITGSQGGVLSSAFVNAYIAIYATGGAVASNIVFGSKGSAYIYSGAVLKGVSCDNGYLYAASDGIIKNAEISPGGRIVAAAKGRTEDVILKNKTSQYVYSGGTAIRTSAMGGWLNVSNGGVVSNTLIGSGGSMSLRDGAKAYGLTVEQGGVVYSWQQGYMYGKLTIGGRVQDVSTESVAGVSSYQFNVQTQMDDAFLSFSSGGIAANSSISIDVSNAWGDYVLIKGDLTALSTATITVKSNGYSSSVSANGNATLGDGRTVKLTQGTDAWSLTISGNDNTPPQTPRNVIANVIDNSLHISWTAVTDFSGVKYEVEYSRNADFSDSKNKIVIAPEIEVPLANGVWYWRIRSVDGAGNTSPWTTRKEAEIDYTKIQNGNLAQTLSVYADVVLARGATINATFPGGVQLLDNGFKVTLLGNNTITCNSIRNGAILFGEDASWGDYYDGTVIFEGTNITLHSEVSNCITAAGIRGNNLTVNFMDAASGAESIIFESTNGPSGPGNYAAGVQAAGDLIVNGDFGGTISCVMDNRNFTDKRYGYVEGFYANGSLEFNGNMDGNIYLAGFSPTSSYAYGMRSYKSLTVNGDIGGIIMATAENSAYGLYGYESITASVSGIIFAGMSTDINDQEILTEKLEHFSENKEELLELSQGKYSIYTAGQADITLTNEALLIGKLYLGSGSQITISGGAEVYGDITTYYSTDLQFVLDNASLNGTRLTTTTWNNRLNISINADDIVTNGTYSLVESGDLSSISSVSFSVDGHSYSLKTNNSVKVGGITYALSNEKTSSSHTLTLTVSGIIFRDREAPVLNGSVQAEQGAGRVATLSWEDATDNVGVTGYELKYDGQVITVNQSNYVLNNVTLGLHTIQIRAFDQAGNYSNWSAEQSVVFEDSFAPVLTSINATPNTATNQNVTIMVEYEEDFGDCEIQYRFSNETNWHEYHDSVVVSSNKLVFFRALDDAGNISDITQYQVDNIDTKPPVAPSVTANTQILTNLPVILTALYSDDSVVREYRVSGGEWQSYKSPVTISTNSKVEFRGQDEAGNWSNVTTYDVTNIDMVPPVITLTSDNTTPRQAATLTASTEDGVDIYWSTNNATWKKYEGELDITSNATYYFKATDAAGNTGTSQITFANIDTVAPVITLDGDATTPRRSATLTASTEAGVDIYWSNDNIIWKKYSDSLNITSNGTWYFKATDAAGNKGTNQITFTNIDRVAPTISDIKADITALTNGTVTVTASASDDANDVSLFYSKDGGAYVAYSGGVEFTANGSVIFKAVDAAGNETFSEAFEVTNIDKVAPIIKLIGDNSTPRQSATLTASTEVGIDIYWSTDNKTWTKYEGELDITSNGTYYFKATDAAGNKGVNAITFANIDRTAPVITLDGDNFTPRQSATLTASTEPGVDIYWSMDNVNWAKYEGELDITANGVWYFKATDAAGNTGMAQIAFTNIDTVTPEISDIAADVIAPTNGKVTVTAYASDDVNDVTLYYSKDGGEFVEYNNGVEFTANGNVVFKAVDAAGNETLSEAFEITNIDTVAPVIELLADTTTPLQKSRLAASTEAGVDIYWSMDNINWSQYDSELDITANGTWYFKATDAAGNTGVAQIVFTNIDTVKPTISNIQADVTAPTNGKVTVTVFATDDANDVMLYYSKDGGEFVAYDGGVEFTDNGNVVFKAIDAAGNETLSEAFEVSNIDKVAPVIELTGDTTSSLQAAKLTANTETGVDIYWSTDNANWTKYEGELDITANGTYYFKATDAAGNTGTEQITFANLDTGAPVITLTGDNTTPLQKSTLSATVDEDVDIYWSTDNANWTKYEGELDIIANGTYYFKATDEAGNTGTNSIIFANIDTTAPVITLTGDTVSPLQSAKLTATTEKGIDIYWSTDNEKWTKYEGKLDVTANGTYYFKAMDVAGNVGTAQITFTNIDTTAPSISRIEISSPDESGLVAISIEVNEMLSNLQYSWKDGEWLDASGGTISVAENGSVRFRLTDIAGNVAVTDNYVVEAFNAYVTTIDIDTMDDGVVVSWVDDATATWSDAYDIVIDTPTGTIGLPNIEAGGVELLNSPSGEMAIVIKPSQSDIWSDAGSINVQNEHEDVSQYVVAEDNGLADVMFTISSFKWNGNYQAQHVGVGEWEGTGDTAALDGKNAIMDVFAGSDDASILLLTDDTNGDALFIDDIYSAFPEGLDAQARIAKIDEIRAGAGDDIVDLTSQRFDYVGGGMTVKGGLGDDVIWANNGDNSLFGDAGNDRIVGAGGNDVIIGGSGDDSMHGGGGEDIFAFGGDWGNDSVEQLATGNVTLWFDEGSMDKWDASTLTYRDGDKSVVVNGVTAENITLKFGDDGSAQYGKLLEAGAFDEFSSERIFENNNKRGILA